MVNCVFVLVFVFCECICEWKVFALTLLLDFPGAVVTVSIIFPLLRAVLSLLMMFRL